MSSPGWSRRASRSSRSGGATTRAAPCRTWAPTTARPSAPSSSGPRALGHTRLAYLGHGEGAESLADRMAGFLEAAGRPAGTARAPDRRRSGRVARRPGGGHGRLRRGVRRRGGHRRRGPGRGVSVPGRPVDRDPRRPDAPGAHRHRLHRLPYPAPGNGPAGRPGADRRCWRASPRGDTATAALRTGRGLDARRSPQRERNHGGRDARPTSWSSAEDWAASRPRSPRCGRADGHPDRGVRLARRPAHQPGGAAGRAHAGSSASASPPATGRCATASAPTTGRTSR